MNKLSRQSFGFSTDSNAEMRSGVMLKGLLGCTCLLSVCLPISVSALPSKEVTRIYFSDASKTQRVGVSILACQGGRFSQGRVTPYVSVDSTPCEGSPGRGPKAPGVPCEFKAGTVTKDGKKIPHVCHNLPTRRPYEVF